MDGRIPTAGGRPVRLDGKSGFVHDETPESAAFRRWQEREFLYVERQFARRWRMALNAIDLAKVAVAARSIGITPGTCRSLKDAKVLADRSLDRDGAAAVNGINLALSISAVPPRYDFQIFGRWARHGRASLRRFAPYSAHVVAVELFFQAALGAGLVGTTDANNRTDVGYLYYTPFCHVFVSSDKLHRRCAPHFLRADQSFVWGPELKGDLQRLRDHYAARPEEEKEQGLMHFAPTPPRDHHESLVVQLWDRHSLPS